MNGQIKIALINNDRKKTMQVYSSEVLSGLRQMGEVSSVISKKELEANKDFLAECTLIFSTWGMPCFTEEEIKRYFPKVRALFYAAGTVQSFAQPFLNCGIRVFSAWQTNGVPVAEYTFAQIMLSAKGYPRIAKKTRFNLVGALLHRARHCGGYECTVGLVGLGAIGGKVAQMLQGTDCEVLCYDAFVTEERAAELGVKKVDLPTLFSCCDVISNHLADKKELWGIYNKQLFKLMKPYSTFINTGRGKQVCEWQLAASLLAHPSRTALIDVTTVDVPFLTPLFFCPNAILTPHIAGSLGNERHRMAIDMLAAAQAFLQGKAVSCEVTEEMLSTMA